MPSDSPRRSDVDIRDEVAERPDSGAPPGEVENTRLTSRPSFLAEEGASDRSDWLSLAKAVAIGVALLAALGVAADPLSAPFRPARHRPARHRQLDTGQPQPSS
jgi:hypothetical protein